MESLVSTDWLASTSANPTRRRRLQLAHACERPKRPRRISSIAHSWRALPRHRRAFGPLESRRRTCFPAPRNSAPRWSASASAAMTASSFMTIRRSVPRRGVGSRFGILVPARSRSSTAASRNGSPKVGRPKPASPRRATPASTPSSAMASSASSKFSPGPAARLSMRAARPRFEGDRARTPTGHRGGHIPGARNLPFGLLYNDDGTLSRLEDLRRLFDEAGIDPTKPFIASCGSGVTATSLIFAAHLLGGDAGRLYDGSWRNGVPIRLPRRQPGAGLGENDPGDVLEVRGGSVRRAPRPPPREARGLPAVRSATPRFRLQPRPPFAPTGDRKAPPGFTSAVAIRRRPLRRARGRTPDRRRMARPAEAHAEHLQAARPPPHREAAESAVAGCDGKMKHRPRS